MGIRLLDINNPEPYLRTRDHVRFIGNWPVAVKDCDIQIGITQPIRWEQIAILQRGAASAANVWDIELNDTNGFLPRATNTLYEIRMAFHGAALLYMIWPTPSTFFYQLENATFRPDVTSESNRYVGFFEQKDLGSPEKSFTERLLRFITVDDMQPMLMRFYAEPIEPDEKIVIDMVVNRCEIMKIDTVPPNFRPIYSYEQYGFTTQLAADVGIGRLRA